MYVIAVTYGTRKHQIYAEVPCEADALLLLEGALERGYKDAKILTRKKYHEAQASWQRFQTSKGIDPSRCA